MGETLYNPLLWAIFLCLAGILALLWRARRTDGGEISGKIALLADAQAGLQKLIAEQLQGQERNLSKNLHDSLSDLKSRMAVFDAAQEKIGQLSQHVTGLQDILSNSKARGAFGEVQLQDLISDALPSSAFSFQETLSNGTRVDCLLRLQSPPGPIGIDAKFPIDAYRAMIAAKDEAEKKLAAKNFETHIKRHIDAIASKYIIPGVTAESALLFLPSEAVFAELHANFESLLQYSYQKRVWLTSPSTMMALLNTVRAILRDSKMREEAAEIQKEVKSLLEDISRLAERMGKLGQYIGQSEDTLRQANVSMDKIARRGQRILEVELGEQVETVQVLRVVE